MLDADRAAVYPSGLGNASRASELRFLAFYLPQFHPIPENDEWWGSGFTDWANVARARPVVRGQYQPHLPSDLGFYDLRLAEARAAQAAMAAEYGIDAFCYYHYWFDGQAAAREALRRGPALGPAGLSLLPLLGERELDADVERARWRGPGSSDVFRARRSDAYPLAGRGLSPMLAT